MKVNSKAPVVEMAEITIPVPRDLAWSVLTDLTRWVDWNPDVTKMEVKGPVAPGTRFNWKAGGAPIKSTIQEVDSTERIVWTGRTMGIRAIHAWTLRDAGSATQVVTEESFEGLLASLLARPLRKMLAQSLSAGLGALASECQRRVSQERE